MKRILLPILLIILLGGCADRKHADPFFLWSATDAPFDSLTRDLDHTWATKAEADTLSRLTARLEALSRLDSADRRKRARAHYFRGRWLSAFSTHSEAAGHLDSAENLLRSLPSHEYESARISYLRCLDPALSSEDRYFNNMRILKYFESVGDSVMTAVTLTAIGNELLNLDDTTAAVPYFERAVASMARLGMNEWVMKFNISLAQIYHRTDKARADSIIASHLASPAVRADSMHYNVVLHNAYIFNNDISHIYKAYPIIYGRPGYKTMEALYEAYMASEIIERGGDTDSMVRLASDALAKIAQGAGISTRRTVYRVNYEAYKRIGKTDSALFMLEQYSALSDTSNMRTILSDIHRNEARQKIALAEARTRESILKERALNVILVAAVVLAALVFVFLLYRRNKRLEMYRMKTDLELLRNRTRLASSAAVLEEKDRAIDSAIDTIDSLGRENKISPHDASLAVGVLKVHKSSRDELEAFQQVHDELDPSFTRRLKESFPDLSESNIRVAAYVAIGMNNKQIARVMMIEYKSVLTARHRLRTKMGLAKTDSLEQALRRFSEL